MNDIRSLRSPDKLVDSYYLVSSVLGSIGFPNRAHARSRGPRDARNQVVAIDEFIRGIFKLLISFHAPWITTWHPCVKVSAVSVLEVRLKGSKEFARFRNIVQP